jgi:hypothetical protein
MSQAAMSPLPKNTRNDRVIQLASSPSLIIGFAVAAKPMGPLFVEHVSGAVCQRMVDQASA